MIKWFYLMAAILSLLEVIYYYETTATQVNQKQILLFAGIVLANYSYSMGMFAETLEGIKIANQLYYLGNILASFFILLVISDLCGLPLNKHIRRAIFLYCLVILILVSTCNSNRLYYTKISLGHYKGATYLIKEYGPLHITLFILLFGCNLYSVAVAMIAVYKNSKISIKTAVAIIIIFTLTTLSYAAAKIFNSPVDVLPFVYVINMGIIIMIFKHSNMYDMSSNLLNVYEQRLEYGYISFDKNKRFMGCNEFAIKIYPSLKNIPLDSFIPKDDVRLNKEILAWMENWIKGAKSEYVTEYAGITAICTMRFIKSGKKNIGYLIELTDVSRHQKYINLLSNYSKELQGQVENKTEKLIEIQDSIITGIASMVESRDNSTGDHIKRTSDEIKIFVNELKQYPQYKFFSDEYYTNIVKAASLHDLGKIAVDDAVLRKPGKYDESDYQKMRKHSEEGARIVASVLKDVDNEEFKKTAINIAHYHHERWDGKGYPSKLSGENIPLEARIMALADVFDALVSERCYKTAYSIDEAFSIISDNLGTQFDPELGKIFLSCRDKLEKMYKK